MKKVLFWFIVTLLSALASPAFAHAFLLQKDVTYVKLGVSSVVAGSKDLTRVKVDLNNKDPLCTVRADSVVCIYDITKEHHEGRTPADIDKIESQSLGTYAVVCNSLIAQRERDS